VEGSRLQERRPLRSRVSTLERLDHDEIERLGLDEITWGAGRQFAWFKQGNHYYRLRDTTASPPKYCAGSGSRRKARFWNGWNDVTVTDASRGRRW
jgi:hypothetical protein